MSPIRFEVNGRRVSPDKLGDKMTVATFEIVKQQVKSKLSRIRCAEHQQYPKVKISGTTLKNMKFSVEGCCQSLIEQANRAFK